MKHINRILRMRMVYSIVEESIVKWFWGSLGLCVCAVPVFGARLFGGVGGLGGVLANVDFGSRTEGEPWNVNGVLGPSAWLTGSTRVQASSPIVDYSCPPRMLWECVAPDTWPSRTRDEGGC